MFARPRSAPRCSAPLDCLNPRCYHKQHPEKTTVIYAKPFKKTRTISLFNPESQPRNDAGNEALGGAGFEEGKVQSDNFSKLASC
ncbi:MAG: hypothetical protein NTV84_10220 [Methanoregula sp.]|nr:hypothetical protein [Methanoregula sp.]